MPKDDVCPNTWTDKQGTVKTCGADLTEARKVRGEELIRCPECGRKLRSKT